VGGGDGKGSHAINAGQRLVSGLQSDWVSSGLPGN